MCLGRMKGLIFLLPASFCCLHSPCREPILLAVIRHVMNFARMCMMTSLADGDSSISRGLPPPDCLMIAD
jgi:hypothetical protein